MHAALLVVDPSCLLTRSVVSSCLPQGPEQYISSAIVIVRLLAEVAFPSRIPLYAFLESSVRKFCYYGLCEEGTNLSCSLLFLWWLVWCPIQGSYPQ